MRRVQKQNMMGTQHNGLKRFFNFEGHAGGWGGTIQQQVLWVIAKKIYIEYIHSKHGVS